MPTSLLGDLLREAATEEPGREAYVHDEKRVTYGWLDRSADGFAATLLEHGVHQGDVVCLMLPSSIKYAACYLGAARIGAITSAIDLRLGPDDQRHVVARSEPRVTVVGDGATVPEGVDPGRVLLVTELKDAFAAAAPMDRPRLATSDPVCIVWTRGTTGVPKGAVYDHEALAGIARNVVGLAALHDRLLFALPFPHLGYMGWMSAFVSRHVTLVVGPSPWCAEEMLRLLHHERVTAITDVPAQWTLLMDQADRDGTNFSGLRIASIGGAPAPPELVGRLRARLGCPVLNGYAPTEAGVITGTRIGDGDDVAARTVGRAHPDVELRIISTTDGSDLEPGEVGEIVCRSPAMMGAYWRDADLTATVIDADGWLHTGDLGVVDRDGNLTIAGRRPPAAPEDKA